MEVEAMLRHFIAQLHNQDYLDSRPQLLLHFPQSRHHNNHNGCIDEGSVDDYYTLIMAKERSESFEPSKPKRPRKDRTRRAKSPEKSKSAESEAVMEQELWKDFPEDLFEAVIARLPVAAFFRSRSVCHKWNSLLTSGSFSNHCSEVARERTNKTKPWLYTVTTTHENAMYDPSLKKWHHLAFPAEKTVLLPAASAAGLVCFHDVAHRSFYVCNPLTRALRKLPERPAKARSGVAVGMSSSSSSSGGGYEIVWLGCEGEYEVFESGSGAWARAGNVGERGRVSVPVRLNLRSQTVCAEGAVYFMRGSPEGVVEYEVGSGEWREYAVPCPAGGVTDRGLAGLGGGRVGMVGLVTRNAATCVCVWELQRMTLLWKEVDRMPNVWCLDLYGKHVRMTCLGNRGGLIVLSLRSRHANRLVAYDVAARHWLKLAPPPGRKKHWIACATAFHPSLTAKP